MADQTPGSKSKKPIPHDSPDPSEEVLAPPITSPEPSSPFAFDLGDEEPASTGIADVFPGEAAFRFAFLGAGQCGGRIADSFWKLGYRRVGAFNTTEADFDGLSPEISRWSVKEKGGASKDPESAARQIEDKQGDIRDLMTRAWGDSFDYALICAGLAGGTGSGSLPILIESARKYMADKGMVPKVGAIVALPSPKEGQRQGRNAVTAFKKLLDLEVSPLIVLDNFRVQQSRRPGASELFPLANSYVSNLLHVFNQVPTKKGGIYTFDASELGHLFDGGLVVMSVAQIPLASLKGEADLTTYIREKLSSSLLAQVNLRKGRSGALVFMSDAQGMKLPIEWYEAGYKQLHDVLGAAYGRRTPTVLHRGLYEDPALKQLRCYTLISELEPPLECLLELAKEGGVDLPSPTLKGMGAWLGLGEDS